MPCTSSSALLAEPQQKLLDQVLKVPSVLWLVLVWPLAGSRTLPPSQQTLRDGRYGIKFLQKSCPIIEPLSSNRVVAAVVVCDHLWIGENL